MDTSPQYFDRELSWLSFNARVLQEAQNPEVPLFERLKFLAIFSSNLDEFFRVRVAALRSLLRLKKKKVQKLDFDPAALLQHLLAAVGAQQEAFGATLREDILPALQERGITLIDEENLTGMQRERLRDYFEDAVRPELEIIPLKKSGEAPFLKNQSLYLVVELRGKSNLGFAAASQTRYALVEVPSPPLPRFVEVPGSEADNHPVMFLDDVIRAFLPTLFPDEQVGAAYAVKLSRDADLYLDDEFSGDLKMMIEKALAKRPLGAPTRFLYDQHMPHDLLAFLTHHFALEEEDLVEGWRYHNLNDFFGFPTCGVEGETYTPRPPLPHPAFEAAASFFDVIDAKDRLLSVPYQSFEYVTRFLDEAARDEAVEEVWITLYRVAEDSAVVEALVEAARRGKRVTAFVEAKARFDEATNLESAGRMEDAGVRVLYSMPGLKVHTKLALVARHEGGALRHYAYLGTGNFNEKTARIYADHAVFTADARLADEVRRIFAFLADEDEAPTFEHLLVAPFTLREKFYELIDFEIAEAQAGRPARILAKMNALHDRGIIDRLYEASAAGVEVRLLVRGICCLVPGVEGLSEHVYITSIVDRFLEHARAYVFHHGGEDRLYLASADWMKRNLSRRVEVAFPIFDPDIREELFTLLALQTFDNTRARIIDPHQRNAFVKAAGPPVRAQYDTYDYYAEKAGVILVES